MDKRIIEINGIKMEVDLSTAKRVDEFKVGDAVKVLRDKKVLSGAIVEFVNFKDLPTIKIAVFSTDYWGSKIEFIYYNADTADVEICPSAKEDFTIEKEGILQGLDREIDKKRSELEDLKNKKTWFLSHYGKYFSEWEANSDDRIHTL